MAPDANPMLFGTEKDYAWDAWQKAFDAGTRLPDHEKFLKWFDEVYLKLGAFSMRDRFHAAWGVGVQDRNEQCTSGFNAWWQEILDTQPKVSS